MAARKITITQQASGTWAGDTTITTALERIGVITQIEMTCEVTPSATLTGANQPDGLFRPIQNMRIVGSQETYFNLPADDGCQGGVLLHYLNRADGFGLGHSDGAITAPSTTFQPINYVYHCGSRPRMPEHPTVENPFDLTALIPASREGQLNAEWTTSGSDVMDDTVTITSAVMRFTVHRMLGTDEEIKQEMAAQRVNMPPGAAAMLPAWSATRHVNVGTTTDFESEQVDVTVGAFLKRIVWITQDATATRTLRASDEVTRVALLYPKTSENLFQSFTHWMNLHNEYGSNLEVDDAAADFQAHVAKGFYVLDWRSRAVGHEGYKRDYGMDLRGVTNGDLKLGLFIGTFAAGDDTLIVFERYRTYMPTDGRLVQVAS